MAPGQCPKPWRVIFPGTTWKSCVVHLIRNSPDYASWKARKLAAAAIKSNYTVISAEAVQAELEASSEGRGAASFPRWQPPDAAPGTAWSVLRVPAGGAARDLLDQRHREHQRATAQDHQDARELPQRRRGQQAHLAGAAQHHGRLGPCGAQPEGAMNHFAVLYEERFIRTVA